jgi:hypothetical protein
MNLEKILAILGKPGLFILKVKPVAVLLLNLSMEKNHCKPKE